MPSCIPDGLCTQPPSSTPGSLMTLPHAPTKLLLRQASRAPRYQQILNKQFKNHFKFLLALFCLIPAPISAGLPRYLLMLSWHSDYWARVTSAPAKAFPTKQRAFSSLGSWAPESQTLEVLSLSKCELTKLSSKTSRGDVVVGIFS